MTTSKETPSTSLSICRKMCAVREVTVFRDGNHHTMSLNAQTFTSALSQGKTFNGFNQSGV